MTLPAAHPDCPTHLTADVPAQVDQFGPHAAVAAAVDRVLAGGGGGQSIGLAGRYGAGKSTVVNLIGARWRERGGHSMWVFDAWAHEGDPLRRTFLESLIGHLRAERWVDDARWARHVEQMARRRKETETRTSPRLSPTGLAVAASALLVPLGSAVFGDALRGGRVTLVPGPVHWQAVLGLLLLLAPLLVLAAISGWTVLHWRWVRWRRDPSAPFPDLREPLALFVQRAVSDTHTAVIETPEPTSIEFESAFADLMQDALGGPGREGRKLVLVVDNLDRIAPADALVIWSTLQTFLQPGRKRPAWLDRLWVIIPYDADALAKLWQQERETGGGIAAAFLDKSFQVRFDVSPPLLANWRAFLVEALRAALPGHSDDEFHVIYRLVSLRRIAAAQAPTPRELKVLVNQIAAAHLQHGHAVPLPHLAYSVLLRRDSVDVLAGALAGSLPSAAEANLLGEDAVPSLAAVEFGVDVREGQQLLLGGPIRRALEQGDGEGLAKLRATSSGFWEVLEQTLEQAVADWGEAESSNLLSAALALHAAGVLDTAPTATAGLLRRRLARVAASTTTWTPHIPHLVAGLLALLQDVSDARAREAILTAFGAHPLGAREEREALDEAGARTIAEDALALLDGVAAVGSDLASRTIAVPGGLDGLVAVFEELERRELDVKARAWDLFRIVDKADVGAALSLTARAGLMRPVHFRAVQSLVAQDRNASWAALASACRERLNANNSADSSEVNALLATLMHLRSVDPSAAALLQTAVLEGHVAHHFWQATTTPDAPCSTEAAARCVYAISEVTPALTTQPYLPAGGNASSGYARLTQYFTAPPSGLPRALATLLVNGGRLDLLFASRAPTRVPHRSSGRRWRPPSRAPTWNARSTRPSWSSTGSSWRRTWTSTPS